MSPDVKELESLVKKKLGRKLHLSCFFSGDHMDCIRQEACFSLAGLHGIPGLETCSFLRIHFYYLPDSLSEIEKQILQDKPDIIIFSPPVRKMERTPHVWKSLGRVFDKSRFDWKYRVFQMGAGGEVSGLYRPLFAGVIQLTKTTPGEIIKIVCDGYFGLDEEGTVKNNEKVVEEKSVKKKIMRWFQKD